MSYITRLAWSVSLAPLVFAASVASAQDLPVETADAPTVEALVVTGDIVFRNRTTDENPVLSYDLEYFQRFEPVSVGEMLKRVPGVTFTSDVLEFDGVSMRGLPPGYTKVTINGRRAPGGPDDGSFMVDRIPAELVERIEIVRSPTADQPSDGMAGTLNVVLKEGATLHGGYAKAGVLVNEDGEARPSASLAYAGGDQAFSYWGALNYQGRRNPKKKVSFRNYPGDPEDANVAYEDDTRDGVDISANGELAWRFDGGRLRLDGLVIDTDRDEDEHVVTYTDTTRTTLVDPDVEDPVADQHERIKQRTYSFGADGELDLGPGSLDLDFGWSAYEEDKTTTEEIGEDFDEVELDAYEEVRIEDEEWEGGAAYTFEGSGVELKGGVDYLRKTRDGALVEFEVDDGVIDWTDFGSDPGGVYQIKETRIDPFVRLTLEPTDMVTLDLGLRYETTDREVTSDEGTQGYEAKDLNPSAHLTVNTSPADVFRASIARTVRRPSYPLLTPAFIDEEPADEDGLRGNPALQNETAWGLDAGYERRIGARGIFGVNLFYRNVEDLIEIVDTGLNVDEDGEPEETGDDPDDLFNLITPRNIGSGDIWGVEFDFSMPLAAVGLPDTGVFFNYTWMESSVRDPFTGLDRAFTNQPSHVYNIGFIHTLPMYDVSFGASLYDRDEGFASALDEEVAVDYDADLEAFIEKRFGERVVLRFAGMNLLDKEKRESIRKFDGDSIQELMENRANGDVDEFEIESERSGALYQVTLRVAF
ncbi:MAG TPA: TonB-dependent receptor [Caulobacteraceae bacterium]|nr:TonB-dependent receptor [Caulobacteraceae bacterium]